MKNNKILHITTVHRSTDNRIFQKEVLGLKNAGFDISLIAQGDLDNKVNGIDIYAVPFSKNRFDKIIYCRVKHIMPPL